MNKAIVGYLITHRPNCNKKNCKLSVLYFRNYCLLKLRHNVFLCCVNNRWIITNVYLEKQIMCRSTPLPSNKKLCLQPRATETNKYVEANHS